MNKFKTEQERFWAGTFGDQYIARNQSEKLLASNISLFSEIVSHTDNIESILELGANIGLNLHALNAVLTNLQLNAVEINSQAIQSLKEIKNVSVNENSIIDFETDSRFDLVFTKTVLIHINPDYLPLIYQKIYDFSKRYICVIEYYNPSPTEVVYRGHEEKLFKRDFAGELLDMFDDLKLLHYGFRYHRDNNFPQDDLNWFLLEKKAK